ncbi:hypothetical protein FA15DRAFT_435840 [Coprinopsis marcescibilis]|uniref:Uncharacterized protein n=1 Tax=Coprinopsis marcescibilis TaxID=230819 RepID=A0A5C3L745_COPMA|nr:hypothetical protein FA15DRAFT_435840 [Coprinopsis marcescibilis]
MQFGDDDLVALCTDLHQNIGSPHFLAKDGWTIFVQMVELYSQLVDVNVDGKL